MEQVSSHVTMHMHRPVFSTRQLPFIGHVPDHTDLGTYHRALADALQGARVIHTTDAFFAYARTAEAVAEKNGIPLVHSVHTDTVAYTRLFTQSMLEQMFGRGWFGKFFTHTLKLPDFAAHGMQVKLEKHQRKCARVLVSRTEDRQAALQVIPEEKIGGLRLGIDRDVFSPLKADHARLRAQYGLTENTLVIAFAGRMDEGKNVYRLIDAVEALLREGQAIFLVAAGEGPGQDYLKEKLGTIGGAAPGYLPAEELAWLYASADILAIPSEVETWSMVAAEALACGCPLLASAKSGVGRFIMAEEAGHVVAENTDAAWRAALAHAARHRHEPAPRRKALAAAEMHFPGWRQALVEDLIPVWRQVAA
jgi:glycosyltransferase involved in cell wall biosynthesis